MPTPLKRLSIVLTPEQHRLLTRLSDLQERSAASYVRRLLDVATPSLRALCASLEGVEAETAAMDENAQAAIAQMVDEAEDELAEQLDLLEFHHGALEADVEDGTGAALADTAPSAEPLAPPYSNTGVRSPPTVQKPVLKSVRGGRSGA